MKTVAATATSAQSPMIQALARSTLTRSRGRNCAASSRGRAMLARSERNSWGRVTLLLVSSRLNAILGLASEGLVDMS